MVFFGYFNHGATQSHLKVFKLLDIMKKPTYDEVVYLSINYF